MREIKFRGKLIGNKKWVYGNLLTPCTWTRIVNYTEQDNGSVERADYHYFDVKPDTVGQFTGMLDCNGKEVYEGDVVFWIATDMRGRGSGMQGAIIWDKHTMSWAILNNRPTSDGKLLIIPRPFEKKLLEVIGNIHDNPELMNP